MSLDAETVERLRSVWDSRHSTPPPAPEPARSYREALLADDDLADMLLAKALKQILPTKDTGARELKLPPNKPVTLVDGRAASPNTFVLWVPDAHRPFHDQSAWDLMLAVGHNMRRRHRGKMMIVCLGDLIDNYSISSYVRDPSRRERFADEVADANVALDELDAIGADSKFFVEGNHEERYDRYIAEHAPDLHGLSSMRQLLRLDARKWSYTPYRHHLRIGKFNVTHDLEKAGARAHEQASASFEGNAVIGHTHRMSTSYRSSVDGHAHCGSMFGWLGDFDKVDYRHRVLARTEWLHGCGVGVMEPDGTMHVHGVPFVNGKACVFGDVIST